MNRLGMMCPNDGGNIDDLLNLGLGVYLVMMDTGIGQAADIKDRYPDARILVRRPGGYTNNPADVINDLAAWYPIYASLGIHDWIPWNEADRREEGGATPRQVADLGAAVAPRARALCPGIRLHWPAAAHSPFYESIGIWKDAASLYDCLNGHWYADADGIDALGRFFESHFPGKEWFVTEYSSRGLGAPPPRLGVEADAYEACRKAHLWPLNRGVIFFIWRWPGAEPGGEVEEIVNDPETRAALTRAAMDFHVPEPLPPQPEPEPPAPEPEPEEPMIVSTAMYLHQFSGGGRAYREKSYREFAQTARAYGIRQIWFKAWQGGSLAVWDKGPLGLSTYDRIFKCLDECMEEGIEAVMWGVPQGNTWEADARIAIKIANRMTGRVHTDLENFKDFWNAPAFGVAGQPPYFQMIKDAGHVSDVSAVGRFGEPELTPWEEIVENVDSVWTQSYAVDFKQPAARVVADDLNAMLRVGVPLEKLGVIQGHNSSRAELDAGWEVARSMGVSRMAIWVWDWAGLTPFEFLRDLSASQPDPEPEPEPDVDRWREIHAAAQTLVLVSEPGRYFMPDGSELTEERSLGEIGRVLQIIDRHRAALAGE
jgi:hypothetical protein